MDSFPKMNFSQHKNDWLRWLAAQIFFIAFISESLPWLIKPFLKIKIYRWNKDDLIYLSCWQLLDSFEVFYFIAGVVRGSSGPFRSYLLPQNGGDGGMELHLLSSGEWLSIAGWRAHSPQSPDMKLPPDFLEIIFRLAAAKWGD